MLKIIHSGRILFSHILLLVLCSGLLFSSCTGSTKKGDVPIAKVGDKYLYFDEIKNIFPKGGTRKDSLSLARLYIDNWVKTQLLIRKAELNLSDEQLDISDELETYRTSLLIYKYETQLLQDKLDTAVSKNEIEEYHEANTVNFSLDEYAVKAVCLKIPRDAPDIGNARRWYVSDREKDIQDLTDYCSKYAGKFDFFDDEWVVWSEIENELPHKDLAKRQISQYNRIEQEDDAFLYLVRIKEKISPGEVAPVAIVEDKVKNIIINKRKLKFISELERNVYNDALSKKQFEIYKIDK